MPDTKKTQDMFQELVAALPELYQPLYSFAELSRGVSRGCADRLCQINAVHGTLAQRLGRPVRVLDLGCAQGYFALNLAACGARVHGVDSLRQNIDLCRFLAAENTLIHATFQITRIEDVISEIAPDQYDMVLGLSVFHHLVHEHGVDEVRRMISILARSIPAGVFELALKEEPLYWGPSQSDEPAEILRDYPFVHELGRFPTHLSETRRPMYFAGVSLWFLNGAMGAFDSFKEESHLHACGYHQGTRRYFFGEGYVVKLFGMNRPERKELNLWEHNNEVAFLSLPPDGYEAPRLLLHGKNENEAWLVRKIVEGELLSECFDSMAFIDQNAVIRDVLDQAASLEKNGLYHNDIRAWNVILSKDGRAVLIDYGAISRSRRDGGWPHDVILAFLIFVREVFSRKVLHPDPVRPPLLDLDKLPPPYGDAFRRLLAIPGKEWSFLRLKEILSGEGASKDLPEVFSADGVVKILAAVEEVSVQYENALCHFRAVGEQAVASAQESAERVKQAEASAEARIQVIEHATDKRIEELRGDFTGLEMRIASVSSRIDETFDSIAVRLAETNARVDEAINATNAKLDEAIRGNEARLTEALHTKFRELEDRTLEMEAAFHAIRGSRSWRMTAPCRIFGDFLRSAWQCFKNLLKYPASVMMRFVIARPSLKRVAIVLLGPFPGLKERLKRLALARGVVGLPPSRDAPVIEPHSDDPQQEER